MKYYHVDVFSSLPLAGNGLTVVFPPENIQAGTMQKITREFNQFETIFVFPRQEDYYPVRIFTVEEELDFAGHPILGAAAVLHSLQNRDQIRQDLKLKAGGRIISIQSKRSGETFKVTMNQGNPSFIYTLTIDECRGIINALSLAETDIHPDYPLEVVSTGLPYLLIPLQKTLENVKITAPDLEEKIKKFGAKFIYVFDPDTLECRTWDNSGLVEDVATGSAAGPLCAYLIKNGFKQVNKKIYIHQGRYAGRDSLITGWVSDKNHDVLIEGDVSFFSKGKVLI